MAYIYPVKYIKDTMRGAPQISGTPGTQIAALDALLLSGWGMVTALSVTVSGGVGTATLNEGEWFEDHAAVLLAGAVTPALLNGEARVLSHTGSSITFATDAPDGTATGTITIKYAPVGGWAKVYSGTNLAVYRCTDVASPRRYLRLNDAGASSTRVIGYEGMTGVSTGTGPFPTNAMMSGGGHWRKSDSAGSASYLLLADSRSLLVAVAPGVASDSSYFVQDVRGFGDPLSLAPGGDAWGTYLSASANGNANFGSGALCSGPISDFSGGFTCVPRALSGLGSSKLVDARPFTGSAAARSGGDAFLGRAPSDVDGQIKLSRLFLKGVVVDEPPRSVVPGVFYVPQNNLSALIKSGDVLEGSGDLAGRQLIALTVGTYPYSVEGVAFVDSTGPWR